MATLLKKSFLIFLLLIVFFDTASASVWSLEGSSSFTGQSSVAMPITDLQISGGNAGDTIPVKLRVASGTLSMSTTTGLTFTGSSTGSTLQFTGTRTNLNNALATLTYTRGSTGTDTLEVSLVESGEVFFEDNGHLYKYISYVGNWNQAKTHAESQELYGATGYLATITSNNENEFVRARLTNAGWMGASDSASEGDWKWVTGPENGTSFWSGLSNGSIVGGMYANWGTGEPNDSGGEDCGQFLAGGTGKWNDLPCSTFSLPGYVVEFGADGDMPEVEAKNISITTVTNPTVSSFSPLDNATGVSNNANLIITFNQNVTVGTGNILIKKSSDDSTVETIDITSDKVSGSGTNTITINPESSLEDLVGYYVEIPNTAFKNSIDLYYAGISSKTTWNFTIGDFNTPTISQVSGISSVTNDQTPSYTFNTNEAGTIIYGGSCSSATTNAVIGNNQITFNSLAEGVYNDCTIKVRDSGLNDSNTISISSFTVDITAPVLTSSTNMSGTISATSLTFNFTETESGTYSVTSCGSSSVVSTSVQTVFLSNLESGRTYSCSISSTDSAGNTSNSLNIGPFTVSIGGPVPLFILQIENEKLRKQDEAMNNNIKNKDSLATDKESQLRIFLRDLRFGQRNEDVRMLQTMLKDMGPDIYPEGLVTGYFGRLTQNAVIRLQEKNSKEILVPINSNKGTGIVGQYTRAFLNNLIVGNI